MSAFRKIDLERVATELRGEEPSSRRGADVRWGTRGSFSVHTERRVWYDHEAGEGGGVIDLVVRHRECSRCGAVLWLVEQGHLPDLRRGARP